MHMLLAVKGSSSGVSHHAICKDGQHGLKSTLSRGSQSKLQEPSHFGLVMGCMDPMLLPLLLQITTVLQTCNTC